MYFDKVKLGEITDMTHWGWYWRVKKKHKRKPLCSSLTCLDSFAVFKKKITKFAINDEHETKGTLMDSGFKIATKDKTYLVPVEKQPCYFGGFRYFLRCPKPTCQQRMRKLYYYRGYFLCRKCLKLGYYTQVISPSRRYAKMRDKIENILKSAGGGTHHKPKWMRKHTFERLRDRYWDYFRKNDEAFEREFKEMFGCTLLEAISTRLIYRKKYR